MDDILEKVWCPCFHIMGRNCKGVVYRVGGGGGGQLNLMLEASRLSSQSNYLPS